MHTLMLHRAGREHLHDEYHDKPFQSTDPLSLRLVRDQKVLAVICSEIAMPLQDILVGEPAELIIVSNLGNIVPFHDSNISSGSAADIEYAVGVQGVERIIVCGHSRCGVLNLLLTPPSRASTTVMLEGWLRFAKPALDRLSRGAEPPALRDLVEANVLLQLENLTTHPCVSEKLGQRRLTCEGWVYDDDSRLIASYHSIFKAFRSESLPM
jgi:carbonic anhydrase